MFSITVLLSEDKNEKNIFVCFFCLPIIGLGQDIPLTEKNITTKKMKNEDRKSIEKTPVEIRLKDGRLKATVDQILKDTQ